MLPGEDKGHCLEKAALSWCAPESWKSSSEQWGNEGEGGIGT